MNELVELFIDTVPGATSYLWTIPPDASFASGQGTPAVSVIWGTSSGMVSVAAQNTCGASQPSQKFLPLDSVPGNAGAITGKDTVCLNHTGYEYSIPVVANAQTYVWSVPGGAVISGGDGTHAITVDYGQDAVAGNVSVFAKNDCGLGVPSTLSIFVSECAGIHEQALLSQVTLFPNPVTGELNVRIRGKERSLGLMISDVTGQQVYLKALNDLTQDYTEQIDVSKLPDGIYFLRLISGGRTYNGKFIVQK